MYIEVFPRNARPLEVQRQFEGLRVAVYPPDEEPDPEFLRITWSKMEASIFLRLQENGVVLGHTGILARTCFHDKTEVLIGGIGGVMTHPEHRQRGLGRALMTCAVEHLRTDYSAAFGLLVCPDEALAFYHRLGWTEFPGTLLVDQPQGKVEFTFNRVMVLPILGEAPTSGTIDLQGPPW